MLLFMLLTKANTLDFIVTIDPSIVKFFLPTVDSRDRGWMAGTKRPDGFNL
jgi:hypothetical protein